MPFTACITCPKLGNGCDGPNFFSLPASDVLEWCKRRKAELRLSNLKLSELSGVPKGTVDSVFAGNRIDFKFETLRPIIRVLVGGEFHGNPCPDPNGDASAKIEELTRRNESLRKVIAENKAAYDADLERERSDAQRRVDYLKKQLRERKITSIILAVALAIAVAVIIIALLIDRTNPDKGFFWLDDLEAGIQNVANRLLCLIK